MEQLETIYPTEKKVLFGEETISIKTFVIDDLPVVAGILEKVLETSGLKQLDSKAVIKLLISSFSQHYEGILTLIATATSLEPAKIKKLNIAALTFLLKHIVQENTDFFQAHMLPIVQEMMQGVQGAAQEMKPMDGVK